jgi:hypothetical protein
MVTIDGIDPRLMSMMSVMLEVRMSLVQRLRLELSSEGSVAQFRATGGTNPISYET